MDDRQPAPSPGPGPGPSPGPDPEVTERHRAQLRAAIDAERRTRSSESRPVRVRTRPLLVAAAVVAVAALAGAAVVALGDDRDGARHVDTAATTAAPAATRPQTCATPPPRDLAIPVGYASPTAISAPEAPTPAASTQQVTTWRSTTGSLETRWPADPRLHSLVDGLDHGTAGAFQATAQERTRVDDGTYAQTLVVWFPDQPSGCDLLQITVYDDDPATVSATIDTVAARPFVPTTPTVTARNAATAVPGVAPCAAPKGVATPADRKGGAVANTTAATPDDALAVFLRATPSLLPDGYTQLTLPDDRVVYSREVPPGIVVTTVEVAKAADGWSVDQWSASGC